MCPREGGGEVFSAGKGVMAAGPWQEEGGEGWGMLCMAGCLSPDLCTSSSCLQFLASVQEGHGRLVVLCCLVSGAGAQQYLRALEFLSALLVSCP